MADVHPFIALFNFVLNNVTFNDDAGSPVTYGCEGYDQTNTHQVNSGGNTVGIEVWLFPHLLQKQYEKPLIVIGPLQPTEVVPYIGDTPNSRKQLKYFCEVHIVIQSVAAINASTFEIVSRIENSILTNTTIKQHDIDGTGNFYMTRISKGPLPGALVFNQPVQYNSVFVFELWRDIVN